MKVKIVKTQGCSRTLDIVLEEKEITAGIEATFKDMAKKISAPGFRKGKVPREIIEKNYMPAIQEEAVQRLVQEGFKDALKELELYPLNQPEVADFKNDHFKKLQYKVTFDIAPEVKLKAYNDIVVPKELRDSSVTDKDIEAALHDLYEARFNAKKKQAAKKAGDSAAEDMPSEKIAPKDMILDDTFAKELGRDSLAALRDDISTQISLRKEFQIKMKVEEFLIDELIKRCQFVLPASSVAARAQYLAGVLKPQGDKDKEFEKKITELAERQVRISYIFAEISHKENIPQQNVVEVLVDRLLKKDTKA